MVFILTMQCQISKLCSQKLFLPKLGYDSENESVWLVEVQSVT